MKKPGFTNEQILEGIKDRDEKTARYVYEHCFPVIKTFVLKNRGDEQDAFDIFQDAYLALYSKLKKTTITLKCEFRTYFYSFCRNLWLKELNRTRRFAGDSSFMFEPETEYETLIDETLEVEEYLIYLAHFNKLVEICRKILQYHFDRIDFATIASMLGMPTAKHARKKKYQCLKQLLQSIRKDLRYKEIKGSDNEET